LGPQVRVLLPALLRGVVLVATRLAALTTL
jgi:hypothetical protein